LDPFYFLLLSLVVWRFTHLISGEDGPFDIVFRLRKKAGEGFWGKLMDCFYCCSVWVALIIIICVGLEWKQTILFWWALSGAACLLERITESASRT
jgi:hypothetical protein